MVIPKSHLGYYQGLGLNRPVHEEPIKTDGEQFFYGKPKKERMAMDIFNLELTKSPGTPATLPLPKIGGAELRAPESPQ